MSVPEVIDRLRAIESGSPRSNGVACFARLYREVTEGVNGELEHRTVADARFIAELDVCFAGLFFTALDAYQRKPGASRPRGGRCSKDSQPVVSPRCSSRSPA